MPNFPGGPVVDSILHCGGYDLACHKVRAKGASGVLEAGPHTQRWNQHTGRGASGKGGSGAVPEGETESGLFSASPERTGE